MLPPLIMLFFLFVIPVAAADGFNFTMAGPVNQCEEAQFSWSGGTPPYYVGVRLVNPSDLNSWVDENGVDRIIADNITETSIRWRVDFLAGWGLFFFIADSSEPTLVAGNYGGPITIGEGNQSCELYHLPSSTAPPAPPTYDHESTTGYGGIHYLTTGTTTFGTHYITLSTTSGANRPVTATSATRAVSTTIRIAVGTALRTTAMTSEEAIQTMQSGQGSQGSRGGQDRSGGSDMNIGAVIGGVVGGILGLALIVAVLIAWLWSRRRHRRKEETEGFIIDDIEDMESMQPAIHPITPYKSARDVSTNYGEALDSYPPQDGTPLLASSDMSPLPSTSTPKTHALMSEGEAPSESDYAVDAGPVREQYPPRYDPRWVGSGRK